MSSYSYKNIWKITYPIILGYMAQNLVYVVDTAFLGRVSEVALGAAAIAGLYYMAVFMLGMGFGTGTQIIIARRYGEGEYASIGKVMDHTFYFLLCFAVIIFLLLKYVSPLIFDELLSSKDVNLATMEYLDYRAFGIFFAFINVGFRAFYVGIGNTRVLIWSTSIMAIVNIILDYVLIFGHWGFPEMGIAGAAIASVISEGFTTAYFLWYSIKKSKAGLSLKKQYAFFTYPKIDRKQFKSMFNTSLPVMFQNFISLWGWFLFYLIIEGMGERPLAVSNIIRSIYLILMIPGIAFYSVTYSLVSSTMGKKQPEQIKPLLKRIIGLGFTFSFFLAILIMLFPREVVSIYTNNTDLINATIPTLNIIALALLILPFSMITFAAVSGTGNTRASLYLEIATVIIYLLCTHWFANILKWEVHQVWYTEWIYLIIIGLLSYIFFKTANWKGAKV